MKSTGIIMITAAMLIFLICGHACSGLTLTLDNNHLEFGKMNIGEWKEISKEGSYHNEVVCSSTNGKTWYLKINLLIPFSSDKNVISEENLKWKVEEVIGGNGVIFNEDRFNNFSVIPQTVYTSGPSDNNSADVQIRFSYGLLVPENQINGNYSTLVRYTMTEAL